jgi:pantoate--beta-alanine ligase
LAMSSRNRYLDAKQRVAAPALYRALQAVRDDLERARPKADAIAAATTTLAAAAQVDYIDVVDAETFAPIEWLEPPALVIGAARFGGVRLIDNLWIAA